MSIGIFGVACASFLTIHVANANDKLSGLAWAVKPLFFLGISSLLFAVYTLVTASRDKDAARERRKESVRQTMHALKREYRTVNKIPGAFTLGAEYYGARIVGNSDLIYEIIETEGERERYKRCLHERCK